MPVPQPTSIKSDRAPYAAGATTGVAMVPPPADLLPSITASITKAVSAIPPDRTAALVALVDTRGVNLAYVQKVGDHVRVMAWAGKSWGTPLEGGASVLVSW